MKRSGTLQMYILRAYMVLSEAELDIQKVYLKRLNLYC